MGTLQTKVTSLGIVLMILGAADAASAQACSQANHHWSFDEYYHYETWQAVCDPDRLSPIELYDCDDIFWRNFPNTYYSPTGADNVMLGIVGIALSSGSSDLWRGMVPVACVIPPGGTAARDGKVYFVHSPRYNASDPTAWSSSFSTLRATSSMCFEGGNDIVTVAKAAFTCGKCGFSIEPMNYNGYKFYISGQEGHDRLTGGLGADVLIGGYENDTLTGDKSADQLRGDAGNDFLYGNAADDYYLGGTGNDWLYDSAGYRDALYGGDGSDCFSSTRRAQRSMGSPAPISAPPPRGPAPRRSGAASRTGAGAFRSERPTGGYES